MGGVFLGIDDRSRVSFARLPADAESAGGAAKIPAAIWKKVSFPSPDECLYTEGLWSVSETRGPPTLAPRETTGG
jgi:hypothetical protein